MLLPKQNSRLLATAATSSHNNVNNNNNDGVKYNIETFRDSTWQSCNLCDQAHRQDIIMDERGNILSGTAEALIQRLIPTKDYCPSRSYIFALLLNIRAVIAPADLLHKVLQQCMFEQNATGENFTKNGRVRMFSHIFKLCSEWTDNFAYDFQDKTMLRRLIELLNLCPVDAKSKQDTAILLEKLHHKLNNFYCYQKLLDTLKSCYVDQTNRTELIAGLIEICPIPTVLARHLTQIELERLNMIEPKDIVNALQNTSLDGGEKDNGRDCGCSSISSYIDWFNHLSVIVATEILYCVKKQSRVRTIEYFIEVAQECINIGNFNSLMAIVAGLSLTPVARLRKTWDRVEKSKLEILQHQLDPSANFLSYRATLKAALWRSNGAKNEAEQIVIPFFGLLLKDLALMYSCCLRPLPNGHLNFTMYSQFSEHMRNFVKWKTRRCPFDKNMEINNYLLLTPVLTEKSLMKLSYDCESAEKEQFQKRSNIKGCVSRSHQ